MTLARVVLLSAVVFGGCAPDLLTSSTRDQVDRKYGTAGVTPEEVVFGLVPPGETPTAEVFVTNTGEQVIDVQALEVQGGGGAFSLIDVPRLPFEVLPGARVGFRVRFQASRGDLAEGQILVQVEADNVKELRVPVNGKGGVQEILVTPETLDFGSYPVGCATVRRLEVANVGSAQLTVDTIRLDTTGELSLVSVPALPLVLQVGEKRQFSMFFEPTRVDVHTGALTVGSDDPGGAVDLLVRASSLPERRVIDRFQVPDTFDVDVLLAVDRSCSMVDQGSDVGTAVAGLVDQLEVVGGDWRVGVLAGKGDHCFLDGWIDATTPDWQAGLLTRASFLPSAVGLTQNGQQLLTEALLEDAALASLEDAPGACNLGFRRPGAMLQVILVSDERDQSSGFESNPATYWRSWVDQLRAYAGVDRLLRIHGVIDEDGACGDNFDPTTRGAGGYLEAVQSTQGISVDVCASPLLSIPGLVDGFIERPYQFELSESMPIPDTITVDLDGVRLSTGWHYEAALNSVVLEDVPPFDAEIVVTYALVGDCPA